MKRRVYAVKVRKRGDVVYLQLLGKGDRGGMSLIAHGAGKAKDKGKNVAESLLREAWEIHNA